MAMVRDAQGAAWEGSDTSAYRPQHGGQGKSRSLGPNDY